ncbi:MAG TPA: malto-oligosyltrehalose trehalohydrolase [Anaeromyxobacter sp.]|nr:malto-oligosyltrehalose trehalohydrolase [Anaeromyxobacter sp.]
MPIRDHGTLVEPSGIRFRVWAPKAGRLAVRIDGADHPLSPAQDGWFEGLVPGARDGTRYALSADGGPERPDPASARQPEGVHGPSEVFDAGRHAWTDAGWRGLPLEELVLYELHVGTFTAEGTLDAAAARLPDLVALGVTCVELMPLQPFAGDRNWGYDGVSLRAVHEGYGGPAALQRFVDRAHALGLGVCLDVVYNHLGPEGNYLTAYGPYLTPRHRSPWGDGLDYDGPGSAPVRELMVGAAVRWIRDFHVDALRLDATHAIEDASARHLVAEIAAAVREAGDAAGRRAHVIAEDDRNDRKILEPPPRGWGASAVWADDLHHAVHALLTGERHAFLADFGRPEDVARALAEGFAYQGEPSRYRRRRHGTPTSGLAPSRFVTCLQNHDQVGNRPAGERIASLVPWEALLPASALVLLGSGTPLLFMGEEYGETAPFPYFTSHSDPALARAVSEGRKKEYIAKGAHDVPDPQDPETFRRSKLSHRRDGRHGVLREHYRRLLALRRRHRAAIAAGWPEVQRDGTAFALRRPGLVVRANLAPAPAGGLGPWGVEVREQERGVERALGDDPRALERGEAEGPAPRE